MDLESNIKIGDFGFAKLIEKEDEKGLPVLNKKVSKMCSTDGYRAPEATEDYDQYSDIFSLGLILFDLC